MNGSGEKRAAFLRRRWRQKVHAALGLCKHGFGSWMHSLFPHTRTSLLTVLEKATGGSEGKVAEGHVLWGQTASNSSSITSSLVP